MKKGERAVYRFAEPVKAWPECDRPKEKLADKGSKNLSDSELLAIIIGSGSGKQNSVDLARDLINRFGSLAEMESATIEELIAVEGIGKICATRIKAALELGRRFIVGKKEIKKTYLHTSDEVFEFYMPSMKNLNKEIFQVALLNSRNRLVKTVVISEGGLTSSMVEPREVFIHAIKHSASGIILLHNHPSGDPSPSSSDKELTKRIAKSGELMNIKVLDHVIIGDDSFYSFADNYEIQ